MIGDGEVDCGTGLRAVRNADGTWTDMNCCSCLVGSSDNSMSQDMEMLDSHGHGMANGRIHPGIGQRANGRNAGGSGGRFGTTGRPGNGGEFPNARNCGSGSYGDVAVDPFLHRALSGS